MKKIKFLAMALLAVMAVCMAACGGKTAPDGVNNLADDNMFRPGQKVDVPTVLDFNATWCIPCKKLAPAFEKAAQADEFKGKVAFYSVDIDQNPQTAEAFNVQAVPTVVMISPDGTAATYVGLGDFLGDADADSPDATETIYANMSKLIQKAMN